MKFIHCADIHLDSPLRGLSRYQDAPVHALRTATRRAFENLVELALSEQVAFVLIAGDLYDGNWQDFNTGLFFVHQMGRLGRAGISVYIVRGNHDADSRLTRSLPLPDNVRVFSSRQPQTLIDEASGVAIHGQSFADAAVTADLASQYPRALTGRLNIGLLHTSINGREGHADYAPCSIDTLLSKGYDYWALGHVHCREVLHRQPWIVFAGNLQGRHSRETGSKGCDLVTVEDGVITATEHRPMDVIRWHSVAIDTTGLATVPAVLERLQEALHQVLRDSEGRPVAARVRLHGRCAAHADLAGRPEQLREDIRALSLSCDEGDLWIEKILLETVPVTPTQTWSARDDALGDLFRLIAGVESQPAVAVEMAATWQDLLRKLPPELAEAEEFLALARPPRLGALLRDVEATLLPRLLEAS